MMNKRISNRHIKMSKEAIREHEIQIKRMKKLSIQVIDISIDHYFSAVANFIISYVCVFFILYFQKGSMHMLSFLRNFFQISNDWNDFWWNLPKK